MAKFTYLPIKEVRTKKPAELQVYLDAVAKQQRELVHSLRTNKANTTHLMKKNRREIARIKTISSEIERKGR